MPRLSSWIAFAAAGALVACSDSNGPDELEPFTLNFAAVHNGETVGCGNVIDGLGPSGTVSVELSDLRFYVSNLRFYDEQGAELPVELDVNDFQYHGDEGDVALVDLTGTASGACAGTGLSFPEGTARTNGVVTGLTRPIRSTRISLRRGHPAGTHEGGAGEPHGCRRTVAAGGDALVLGVRLSFLRDELHGLTDGGTPGEGYVHVGSTDCGGDGTRALTDRDTCGRRSTRAAVRFEHFHLDDAVGVDMGALLAGLDFRVEQTPGGPMIPGVASHSSPTQPHTATIFANLGIDMATGAANAAE